MDLATATAEDFRPWVASEWLLSTSGAAADEVGVPLVLGDVHDGDSGGRPFTLTFSGPAEPVVPQGTWRLSHPSAGILDLFLGPVGITGSRVEYAAVFN